MRLGVLFVLWCGVYVAVLAEDNSSNCTLGNIPNYHVWLESRLRVEFNSSENCINFILARQGGKGKNPNNVTSEDNIKFVVFTIPSVSIEFNNVTMTVVADNTNNSGRRVDRNFFIFTHDTANEVENISNTTNCSHTVVCWKHPQPKELPISYYSYQLTSNDTLVQNVTTDYCVAFDLTVIKPNMLGFNFTVEAHTPPWNGIKVSIQLIAATAPSVKYSYDVAIVHTDGHPKKAVLLLTGMIDHLSCPTADPTVVYLQFTCGHNPPAVQPIPVHMASSNTTKVIQSDPVEAGHRNCIVVVISSNLSGETINESHVFNTTDVQVFSAHQNSGKICFTFEFAINSSIVQFMVNVSSSTGKNLQSILIWRTSDQRKLTNETKVLPVGLYHLRLFAWDSSHSTYVFTDIAMSVNVTWSNYSSPTLIFTPSPTLMLTSPTPILTSPTSFPTANSKLIVAIAVPVAVALLVVALAIGSFVAYQCYIKRCKCHRMSLCDHHRPQNEAVFYRDGHVYFERGEGLNNVDVRVSPQPRSPSHPPTGGTPSLPSIGSTLSLPSMGGIPLLTSTRSTQSLPSTGGILLLPSTRSTQSLLSTGGTPSLPSTGSTQSPLTLTSTGGTPSLPSTGSTQSPLTLTSTGGTPSLPSTGSTLLPLSPPSTGGTPSLPSTGSTISLLSTEGTPSLPSTGSTLLPLSLPSMGGTLSPLSTDDVQLALTTTGDQDLQTPSDKSSQQALAASNVEGGDSQTPWPTIEHLRETYPSAVPVEASTAISMMGLSKYKPLAPTSTQGLSIDVVVVHPETHTGTSPDPTSAIADSDTAFLPQTSSPPPVQRAHHKPVQQVTYPVQETTTTTADSETALLSLTPPPVHGHPEPVVSHPVHETTTTTTADSEKALLLTTASPFVSKKPAEESYPVQETAPCTTTSSEERTVPSSLIVPTQPKPEAASFPMQQTAASYTTSKPLKTLESAVIHASSEPAPIDSAP